MRRREKNCLKDYNKLSELGEKICFEVLKGQYKGAYLQVRYAFFVIKEGVIKEEEHCKIFIANSVNTHYNNIRSAP